MSRTNYDKPKTKEHLLEPEDIVKVEKKIKTPLEAFVFYALIYTGLRISELVHLRNSWIDKKRHLITIPDKMKCDCSECSRKRKKIKKKAELLAKLKHEDTEETEKRIISRRLKTKRKKLSGHQKTVLDGYWVPKTKASARTIPIVPEAQKVIYPFFKQNKMVLDVFPARQYINNVLKRLEKRSKVKLFPHALRGTFATMLASRKFTPYEITDTMGWSDINVAIFYIKLSGEVLSEAFEEKWVGF